jgi:hypothetical protein
MLETTLGVDPIERSPSALNPARRGTQRAAGSMFKSRGANKADHVMADRSAFSRHPPP